jgi:hypothetical protein
MRRLLHTLILSVLGGSAVASAQGQVSVATDVVFYGDDTEFHGPFREGETLFGAAGRVVATIAVNDHVSLTLGALGDHRFGGEAFNRAVPVAALTLTGGRSTLIFGSLPSGTSPKPIGPDRQGLHGLLPPLQRDNLSFERFNEAGLEWTYRGSRLRHDAWINWQRLNTPAHRERFDVGVSGTVTLVRALAAGGQLHVVHEGGQLFSSGVVSDSAAYAGGLILEHRVGPFNTASVEGWGLLARHVPDRQEPSRSSTGHALFTRLAAEHGPWRGHLIVWRGRDFVKEEGDPNYFSERLDGSPYRGVRDYGEIGLARRFSPAPQVAIEMSARAHRIEQRHDYSFRVFAVANLKWPITR